MAGNQKGQDLQAFNLLLQEKDQLIATLQQKLRNSDGKSSKKLSLVDSSDNREDQGKAREQVEIIKKLRERILQLEVDN